MSGGGTLVVRCREAARWKSGEKGMVMTIADTGDGMSPAVRQKLFSPFCTTKNLTGTGLGLAAKVRILRFKNLPLFRHDRGLRNHV
jgi:C4-dicarboxylate-specific signal transduction histidine kinase